MAPRLISVGENVRFSAAMADRAARARDVLSGAAHHP
jgi:hypothetical protein